MLTIVGSVPQLVSRPTIAKSDRMIFIAVIFLATSKSTQPLSAGASVAHGVDVEAAEKHVNRAADRGCVSRLVRLLHWRCVWSL